MAWYPVLGSSVFFIGVVISIIIYFFKRKWHPVIYIISICTYIFTAGFIIDVFSVEKNGILLILAISALLMIGLGVYLSKALKGN